MPNGGRAKFAYLDKVSDADQYQGRNVTDVWIEEVGLYPTTVGANFLPRPIARMKAVLRGPIGVQTQMVLTGNPGGPGQHWLSQRYGLIPFPTRPKMISVTSETGERSQAAVIPSRVEDNHMIDQVAYVRGLRQAGSAALVSAWLKGDWTAVEGAFFDCWNERRHVVRPFAIPNHWLRFCAMDWGFASPFAIYWFAVASDATRLLNGNGDAIWLPRGALVAYREWYGTGGARLTAKQVAHGMLAREAGAHEIRGADASVQTDIASISFGVLDPSAFAEDGGPSHAEEMSRAGVTFRPADNARVKVGGAISGWDQMRNRLVGAWDGDGQAPDDVPPMMVFTTDCPNAIRTIPVLQHDPDKPEDLDTTAEDHAADAVRYGCMSRPWTRALPERENQRILQVHAGPGYDPSRQPTLDDLWEAEKRREAGRI